MAFPKKKPTTREDLAGEYRTWQGRQEALEAERPALYARVMESQQAIMEGEGDPKALQAAKSELVDLDQRLESVAAKLSDLWGRLEAAVTADIAARRQAIPETEAALEVLRQQKCDEAARLFAAAMALVFDMNVDQGSVAKILGLPGQGVINRYDRVPVGFL